LGGNELKDMGTILRLLGLGGRKEVTEVKNGANGRLSSNFGKIIELMALQF
jgi:hypothetical protein